MKKVLVLLAEGFEDVEAITPIDYLRRAEIEVTTVSLGKTLAVMSSHDIQVNADVSLESIMDKPASAWDGIVVPGGLPGTDNIAASKEACAFIKKMNTEGKLVAAICAAPARVLAPLGLLDGKKFTCYPGEEKKVNSPGAEYNQAKAVVDGNIVTSQGPGTAGQFACAIVGKLLGESEAAEIADMVLLTS